MINRSKKNLEEYIAESCKSNPKEFYSFDKSKKALICNISPLTKGQKNHTNDENEIATILNNFFASIFTEEDCSLFQPLETRRTENFLNDIFIVENDDVKKIDKM